MPLGSISSTVTPLSTDYNSDTFDNEIIIKLENIKILQLK